MLPWNVLSGIGRYAFRADFPPDFSAAAAAALSDCGTAGNTLPDGTSASLCEVSLNPLRLSDFSDPCK